jgi:VWFA-related protein
MPQPFLRRLVTISGALSAAALLSADQAPQPSSTPPPVTFKVETSYVEVDAVAIDQKGAFVTGLTKDDFELFEDGKPQRIDIFSYVDIPAVPQDRFLAAGRPVSSDVRSNAPTVAGRLYVLVLDDLGTNPLRSQFVVRSARQFVERYLAANDLAAIVYTSGRADVAQEFTGDRRLLLASIDKFAGRKLLSLTLEKADQFFHQHMMEVAANADSANDPENNGEPVSGTVRGPKGYPDVTTDPDDFERGYRAQEVLRRLKSLSETLSGVRGRRKALLLFSEGIDYPIYDIFGSPAAADVVQATKDALGAAARSNVTFFTIDPRGLVGMSAEEIELGASADPSRGFDAHGLVAEMRLSQDSLRTLADETGGFAAVNYRNDAPIFERIVRASSTYYLLGYYPADHPRDGTFHKIEVRAKRQGLRMLARKGYASPRGRTREESSSTARKATETSPELREVLNSPLQQSGVTLSIQAAPFKGASKDASVAVAIEVDGGHLRFERTPSNAYHDDLEVSFFALDDKGKPHQGAYYNLNLTLRPDTFERVKTGGLRVSPRVALAPGRYQFRIGVRESGAGELGTVFYDLDVPDFTRRAVMLSGLLLTADSSIRLLTPEPDSVVTPGVLPGPATSRREFPQTDTLKTFAELYDNVRDVKHDLDVVTTLLGEGGTEAFRSTQTFTANASRSGSTFQYSTSIPLEQLQSGRYLLRVEASARGTNLGDAGRTSRETLVTVLAAE